MLYCSRFQVLYTIFQFDVFAVETGELIVHGFLQTREVLINYAEGFIELGDRMSQLSILRLELIDVPLLILQGLLQKLNLVVVVLVL
jgi:hypothetical protein